MHFTFAAVDRCSEEATLDEIDRSLAVRDFATARYSASSETIFEQDLARVARLEAGDADGLCVR